MKFASSLHIKTGGRVTLPQGAPPVSDPQHPTQCWALLLSRDKVTYQRCRSRARGAGGAQQKCTCWAHHKLEAAAQQLKATRAG